MMEERLYIDDKDVYELYGVYVVKDGWNELIAYPPLKAVNSNDWQEEDGIEADLSDPKLNTKEGTLKVAYSGVFSRFIEFVELLADKGYHVFRSTTLNRTFTLRLTQVPNLDAYKALGFVTLTLANDYPLQSYTYQAPQSSIATCDDFLLDGKALTDYGCRILRGGISEIMKPADVKPALTRNISTVSGAQYDGRATVQFKSKDVKLNCLMRAATLAELWRNYDALLYDLTRPEERALYVSELERTFPCYYKSATVTQFFPTDKIWLAFTLTLTLTRDFRLQGGDMVLATEEGIILFTEDGENAIDIEPTTTGSTNVVQQEVNAGGSE